MRTDIEKFRKLEVWRKAHALVLATYEVTKKYPDDEKYGLVSQMRRAAIPVASNIAEGTDRPSQRDRLHFHDMARTSLGELKYQILLSYDSKYMTTSTAKHLTECAREVGRMLRGLDRSLPLTA